MLDTDDLVEDTCRFIARVPPNVRPAPGERVRLRVDLVARAPVRPRDRARDPALAERRVRVLDQVRGLLREPLTGGRALAALAVGLARGLDPELGVEPRRVGGRGRAARRGRGPAGCTSPARRSTGPARCGSCRSRSATSSDLPAGVSGCGRRRGTTPVRSSFSEPLDARGLTGVVLTRCRIASRRQYAAADVAAVTAVRVDDRPRRLRRRATRSRVGRRGRRRVSQVASECEDDGAQRVVTRPHGRLLVSVAHAHGELQPHPHAGAAALAARIAAAMRDQPRQRLAVDRRVVKASHGSLNWPPPGGIPERSKGTGCKPVGSAFAGSNPAPTTCAARSCPPALVVVVAAAR